MKKGNVLIYNSIINRISHFIYKTIFNLWLFGFKRTLSKYDLASKGKLLFNELDVTIAGSKYGERS